MFKFQSLLIALSIFTAALAHAELSAEPLVNQHARGGEVRLVSSTLTPHYIAGGWGPTISGYTLNMVVEVAEIDYNKHFRLVLPPAAGVANPRTTEVSLSFEDGSVRYLGTSGNGRGLYEIKVAHNSSAPFKLEVIMPAKFNSVPNIGNPVFGFYGPTYGLENIH